MDGEVEVILPDVLKLPKMVKGEFLGEMSLFTGIFKVGCPYLLGSKINMFRLRVFLHEFVDFCFTAGLRNADIVASQDGVLAGNLKRSVCYFIEVGVLLYRGRCATL